MRTLWAAGIPVLLQGCALLTPGSSPSATALTRTQAAYPRAAPAAITRTNSIGMKLVKVPAGTFQMGDPRPALGGTPVHAVTLSSFWIGQYEVTNGELDHFLQLPRPQTAPTSRHPATNVTWEEADRFCKWLSRKEHRTYRLPTEAEWEYAARGGLQGKDYPWGDMSPEGRAQVAALLTAPVGSYSPNGFGLYDMAGNVEEYVSDWYEETYPSGPSVDPKGPASPPTTRDKVTRDGPFGAWEPYCAVRLPIGRNERYEHVGFRIVLEIKGNTKRAVPAPAAVMRTPPATPRITDPEILDALTRSPNDAMVLAINRANWETVLLLLKMGARVDLRGYEEVTPLHRVVASNNLAHIKSVLSLGADIDARDIRGDTPLIDATQFCDSDVVALLLNRGARVDQANLQGVTPLMWAADAGNASMVRLLLQKGADRSKVDSEGHNALWFARKLGNPETVRLLK